MSLSLREFIHNCSDIVLWSSELPGCEWRKQSDPVSGDLQYISHSTVHSLGDDDFCTVQYHVTYSDSYKVPVLYFNAWLQDGKLLRLPDVWRGITKVDETCAGLDPWAVLTQQEHPHLHQPWFMVHPCKTEEMMRQAISMDSSKKLKNYVLTWLSAVAPLVGLRLPLALAKEHGQ